MVRVQNSPYANGQLKRVSSTSMSSLRTCLFANQTSGAKLQISLYVMSLELLTPHQRIGLAKASPFVREWAEGVFVWLSKHDLKERRA